MQDFRAFPEYLTGEMWQALTTERTTAQARIDLLLGHAAKLQLRCPSEATFQRIGAVFLTCSEGHDRAFALTPHLRYNSFATFEIAFQGVAESAVGGDDLGAAGGPGAVHVR